MSTETPQRCERVLPLTTSLLSTNIQMANTDTEKAASDVQLLAAVSRQRSPAEFIFSNALLRDLIIPYCSPATLVRLLRVCTTPHAAVPGHISRTFDINELLLHYFDAPPAFRSLGCSHRGSVCIGIPGTNSVQAQPSADIRRNAGQRRSRRVVAVAARRMRL